MSSSESDVSNANGSYDYESEENYAIEVEGNEEIGAAAAADVDSSTDDDNGLLEYDPVADEEYVRNYERAIQESREEESILSRRFEGIEQLDSWFLRSISYRSFTRLIHGRLGNKRIPLPACAYNAIRQEFPVLAGNAKGFESNSSE
eukprot:gene6588-biopygen632